MNNKDLLINYTCLPIYAKDFQNLGITNFNSNKSKKDDQFSDDYEFDSILKSNLNIYQKLNPNLDALINCFSIRYYDYLGNIYIRENDTVFNLNNLKIKLCKLFKVNPDTKGIQNLKKMLLLLDDNKSGFLFELPFITLYNEKGFLSYLDKKTRKKYIIATYLDDIKKAIMLLIDLLEDEYKYAQVDISFVNKYLLKLYLAYQVMEHTKKCKLTDNVSFKGAIYYLKTYLNNNAELLEKNYCFNFSGEEYRILEIKNFVDKETKVIDKPSSKKEVQRYNYSFLESKITDPNIFLESTRKYGTLGNNSKDLTELLERKILFYKSLNIQKIKVGVDSFDGYVGFLLDNGCVILDKFFNNKANHKIAYNNAIYIVREKDFELIARMSKHEVMASIKKGEIIAERVIHGSNFEKNALEKTNLILSRAKEV